jgi:hypothetical protein
MSKKGIIFGFLGAVVVLLFFLFSNRREILKSQRVDQPAVSASITPSPESVEAAKPSPTPSLPKSALKLAPKDLRKIVVLQELMELKDEHDPRIEKDLSGLSAEVKSVIETLYEETPPDHAQERGIIVLVIGRQIAQKADIDFLKSVLMEKTQAKGDAKQAYYPQVVAVRTLVEQYRSLRGNMRADKTLAPNILEALREATHAPSARVSSDAEDAINYLTHKK